MAAIQPKWGGRCQTKFWPSYSESPIYVVLGHKENDHLIAYTAHEVPGPRRPKGSTRWVSVCSVKIFFLLLLNQAGVLVGSLDTQANHWLHWCQSPGLEEQVLPSAGTRWGQLSTRTRVGTGLPETDLGQAEQADRHVTEHSSASVKDLCQPKISSSLLSLF